MVVSIPANNLALQTQTNDRRLRSLLDQIFIYVQVISLPGFL